MRQRSLGWWARIGVVLLGMCVAAWLVLETPSNAQSPANASSESSGVYTTAHENGFAAVREFFGLRPKVSQPIFFPHNKHLAAGLQCVFCHVGVDQGPDARIPSTNFCMTCHIAIATDKPEIKKLTDYNTRGEDVPWQRVYGFEPSAHVKFNHAPHIRAGVDCATCHGDMTKANVAERTINHTMGFCITCHQQKQAPLDCVTCHF